MGSAGVGGGVRAVGVKEDSMSVDSAKELLKVERQIVKVTAILQQLQARKAELLAALR